MTARWRSVLFVPASRPELAAKALRSNPDAVVVDLEDAVPPDAKADARATMRDAVSELVAADGPAVCVRVNPPGTAWHDDDVASLPGGLAAIVVPKADALIRSPLPVVAGVETVRGVLAASLVLQGPVVACYFGAEDYVADLGGVRTAANDEVTVPRAMVAMAARVAGVTALDMVTIDFHDEARFRREVQEARALGYGGKLCIHPDQVALATEAFRPTPHELDWATRVLAAFDEAEGATIAFEGEMVDEVVAARARALLEAAE